MPPLKVGQTHEFAAHGRNFAVKRLRRNVYFLRDLAVSERSRWGTKAEITQDVAIVLQCGALPGAKKRLW